MRSSHYFSIWDSQNIGMYDTLTFLDTKVSSQFFMPAVYYFTQVVHTMSTLREEYLNKKCGYAQKKYWAAEPMKNSFEVKYMQSPWSPYTIFWYWNVLKKILLLT